MITNTEAFYTKAKEYQDLRAKMVSDYESKVEKLKKYEGSQGYEDDLEKVRSEHKEALTALQSEYRKSLQTILKGMSEAIGRRKVNPPSNEQLNLIHLLKMRENVTQEELDRVAEMVKDNGIAMGIVEEIAHANGIMKNYQSMCTEMSSSYAQEVVKGISNGLEDWILYDTGRGGRRANQYFNQRYGTPERELPKRPVFEDMDGCFYELAGLNHDSLQLFSEAVNCE